MTQSHPALPQPQLEKAGITFEQYVEFTPEKLELRNGYLGYGSQDQLGFHDCCPHQHRVIISNSAYGLVTAIAERRVRKKLATVNADPEVAQAMLNQFNQAMADLTAVLEYLEE